MYAWKDTSLHVHCDGMRFILCICLLLGCCMIGRSNALPPHAIYISTLDISENAEGLNVLIKVFEDDLRDAMRDFHGHIIDVEAQSFEQEVSQYFEEHLKIVLDKNIQSLQLLSIELVGESYQVDFILPKSSFTSVSIEATYFFDLFPTQQNVLNLQLGGKKKYHIFKKGNGGKSFVVD